MLPEARTAAEKQLTDADSFQGAALADAQKSTMPSRRTRFPPKKLVSDAEAVGGQSRPNPMRPPVLRHKSVRLRRRLLPCRPMLSASNTEVGEHGQAAADRTASSPSAPSNASTHFRLKTLLEFRWKSWLLRGTAAPNGEAGTPSYRVSFSVPVGYRCGALLLF